MGKGRFDHRREPTEVAHLLEDYERNTLEDDLTHLPEILQKHDLSMDSGVGTTEEFHLRSLNNFENRCLHHHVFDENNSRALSHTVGNRGSCGRIGMAMPYRGLSKGLKLLNEGDRCS